MTTRNFPIEFTRPVFPQKSAEERGVNPLGQKVMHKRASQPHDSEPENVLDVKKPVFKRRDVILQLLLKLARFAERRWAAFLALKMVLGTVRRSSATASATAAAAAAAAVVVVIVPTARRGAFVRNSGIDCAEKLGMLAAQE